MKASLPASAGGERRRCPGSHGVRRQAGTDGIRKYIGSGILPADSPVTVNGGWICNRAAHKSVYVFWKGKKNPCSTQGRFMMP